MLLLQRGAICFALITSLTLCLFSGEATAKRLVVFAPHPDDEVLMAAGVIRNAITEGDSVTVVVMTNGDINGVSSGYNAIRESVAGLTYLGLDDQKIVFLGYGDASLLQIYRSTSDTAVFTSRAGVTQTYGDQGLGHMDYHRYRTGSSASYTRENILGDVEAVLQATRPTDVYLTSIFDDHSDHRATDLFVTETLVKLKRQGFGFVRRVHEGLIHAPCEYCDPNYHWPMPSFTPTTPFPMPAYLNTTPLVWAQVEDLPVPPEMRSTSQSTNMKYQAIAKHASKVTVWHFSFVKSNEIFWPVDFANNVAPLATATASSTYPGYSAAAAIDGFVDGYPRDVSKEWAPQGQATGATLTITWSAPQSISSITLHDRPNSTENVRSGTLTFSDGSSLPVGTLPNNAAGLTVPFATKTVTWVRFRVDTAVGPNPGLSEIEVFRSGSNNPPSINTGPSATPSTIEDTQTSALSVGASDPDGDALAYSWSSSGGTVSGSGSTATFTPPTVSSSTPFSISVQVTDGRGGSATGTTTVTVTHNSLVNIARSASVAVSSERPATGQLGIKAVDGVVAGYPGDYTKEWATLNQLAGAWITLSWPDAKEVGRIVLHDRPNTTDNIRSGTLLFSDGSSLPFGTLPNDGSGLVLTFAPKQLTSVQLRVDSAVGQNIGLSEFEAFAAGGNNPPQITSGPTANPTSINDAQTSTVSVTATDPDADPLAYAWSASGGSLSGSGTSVVFTPPTVSEPTSFTVSVTASDGRGGSASGNTSVDVSPQPPNNPPQITSGPTANPASINDAQTSTVSVTATDPDADPLAYAWSASGGSLSGSGTSVVFTPPTVSETTSFTVSVTVSDGRGGSISGNTSVSVAPRPTNLAPSAAVTVSSERPATGQFGIKAIDGVVAGWPGDYTKEWATMNQLAGAWITLTWTEPHNIGSVVLYDRPNLTDNVRSGTILFSDGSNVPVGTLPNNAAAHTVSFAARSVTSLQFRVDTAVGLNIGLAEIQVFDAGPGATIATSAAATQKNAGITGDSSIHLRLRSENPVHDRARFELSLPREGHVWLAVFDLQGRLVSVLADERAPAGLKTASWSTRDANGQAVAQGVYYVQARIDGEVVRASRVAVIR